jgi:glycosyltransferase involved in cell wall biosynthesis
MRIGLNLLHALPEIGGGWNYIANLVRALAEHDNTNTYIAFVTEVSECIVPPNSNITTVRIGLRSAIRAQRVLYENSILQLLAIRHHLDCMHWFASTQAFMNSVPGAVTVYDMQPFLHLANYSRAKRIYLQVMVSRSARRARMFLPMSEATAQDLSRVLNVGRARMTVIPPIMEARFKPATAEAVAGLRIKYKLPEKFWLYTAHMYPHKNHVRLLHAYRMLKSGKTAPWPLILRGDPAGAEHEVLTAITHLDLQKDVIMLPRLGEEELPLLYSAASALIFPSLYEGGGMPVSEAMACGCPVIASDISATREFAGDAALYFSPLSIDSIAEAMQDFQNHVADEERMRRLGLIRATEFRALPVIRKLLGAYTSTVQKSQAGSIP